MPLFDDTRIAFESKSEQDLRKAQILFKMIASPFLTKMGTLVFKLPFILQLPGVKSAIRQTIYKQFVGGETPAECLQVAKGLAQYGVCSIMDYSVEGQEGGAEFDSVKDEILRLIEIAKNNPKEIPFVVFKPTGFGKIGLYEKVGKKQIMTEKNTRKWEAVRNRFDEVCKKSYESGVTIMIDAEESWMQDAADELVDEMMQKYNKEKCVVYNTLQMYRHDRLFYLRKTYEKAEAENYYLGFKVVRGAYMEKERDKAADEGYPSPIPVDKAATGRDYNAAVDYVVANSRGMATPA